MHTCIYTRKTFTSAAGEHILQNSLGARWTSSTIVCDEAQAQFGSTLDAALADDLEVFRNLFGVRGGRGEPAPVLKKLPAASGEVIDLEPSGQPRLNRPVVEVSPASDGSHTVHLELGHDGHVGWAIHEVKKLLPNAPITPELVRQLSAPKPAFIRGPVTLDFGFGGPDYSRATLKAIFNLAAAQGAPMLDTCFDSVRNFILHGHGESQSFLRFAAEDGFEPSSSLGPIDHFVAIVSRDNLVEAFIRFYGTVQHVARLTTQYSGPALQFGYLVNPLRDSEPAETRAPVFNADELPSFDKQPELPEATSYAVLRSRLNRALQLFYQRAQDQMVSTIIKDTLTPHIGQPFTRDLANELSVKLAKAVCRVSDD